MIQKNNFLLLKMASTAGLKALDGHVLNVMDRRIAVGV